jgi:hypothetical protein
VLLSSAMRKEENKVKNKLNTNDKGDLSFLHTLFVYEKSM